MPERHGLDVLLDAGRDVRLVAPGVEALQVGRRDGGEEGGGFGVVGCELLGEGGGKGRLEVADSWRLEMGKSIQICPGVGGEGGKGTIYIDRDHD